MKKIIGILLTLVVVVSVLMTIPLSANAVTQAEAVKWCEDQIGKQIEFRTPAWMFQCMDFVAAYADVLGYGGNWGAVEYAKDLASYNHEGWTRIQGTKDLRPGDVFIITTGDTGHTGVIVAVNSSVTVIDQNYNPYNGNYNGGGYVQKHDYPFSDIWGVLRPTLTSPNYGFNDTFLVPIEPPVAGSIPISTKAELEAIKNNLGGSYHLTKDIDLSGAEWVPIGDGSSSYSSSFTGTFDGQGHVIKNLTINDTLEYSPNSQTKYYGLFGFVYCATIKNVGLVDTNINIQESPDSTGYGIMAGGICGVAYGFSEIFSTINNCYNTGAIVMDIINSGVSVGGICGASCNPSSLYNTTNNSISNCYNSGSISSFCVSSGPIHSIGGICGLNNGIISNCQNAGEINEVTPYASSSSIFVGGICGYSYYDGIIKNCYSSAKISSSCVAGGICGSGNLLVSNCYNKGEIIASYTAGGIVGSNVLEISNSYNSGRVTAISCKSFWVTFAGGICGSTVAITVIGACYNYGNVTASVADFLQGGHQASYAGGILGFSTSPLGATINGCANRGDITASSEREDQVYTEQAYAGGICGCYEIYGTFSGPPAWGTINNCYNTGEIGASAISDRALSYAGGICGTTRSAVNNAIDKCYNAGSVSASSLPKVPPTTAYYPYHYASANGIAEGGDGLTVSNCVVMSDSIFATAHFNYGQQPENYVFSFLVGNIPGGIKNNNRAVSYMGGNAIDDATVRISDEMVKTQTMYESMGWDFNIVWKMPASGGYPVLQSECSTLGHNPGPWIQITVPKIGMEGLEKRYCTICGAELESRAIPALVQPPSGISTFLQALIDFFARVFDFLFGWIRVWLL